MLAIRKLKTGPDIPFVLYVMVANCNYGTARVSSNKSVQSIVKSVGSYLANSSSQAFPLGSENKFTLQGLYFSSVAERSRLKTQQKLVWRYKMLLMIIN